MNSRISMRLDDEEMEVTLVYPEDENERSGKLSIFSDIGAAILGYRDGDAIDCLVANRTRCILLGRMKYQPEAAGDLNL